MKFIAKSILTECIKWIRESVFPSELNFGSGEVLLIDVIAGEFMLKKKSELSS